MRMGNNLLSMEGKITGKNPQNILGPSLFWDADDIDLDGHADYIIARILDYGDEKDVKKLRALHSDHQLIRVIKEKRGLSPMTREYWSVYFNLG